MQTRAGRAGDSPRGLERHRRAQRVLLAQHAVAALAFASGLALMGLRGWGLGQARWLALKVGLVAFLVLPLEAIHAYACHVWVRRGLAETAAPPFSQTLRRGLGMEEMVRALATPLLGAGIPLLLWLSLAKPF